MVSKRHTSLPGAAERPVGTGWLVFLRRGCIAMQNDVRFGLVVAAGVVLACGSKRLSFTTPEATLATKEATAGQAPTATDTASAPAPASPSGSPESALVDLFPEDLRVQTKKREAPKGSVSIDSLTKNRPSTKSPAGTASETSLQTAGEKSGKLVLPGMDWLDSGKDAEMDAQRPKPLPDATSEVKPTGPAHPYFQRYLDEGAYFVREGETLEEIAHNLYQDARKASAIVESNPELLKSSEDLRPGMRLKLPR